jgi:hypothetical protein
MLQRSLKPVLSYHPRILQLLTSMTRNTPTSKRLSRGTTWCLAYGPDIARGPPCGWRCEYECATQGKTGTYRRTFPANQLAWIEFCVETFTALLAKPDVQLADPRGPLRPPAAGYVLLECFQHRRGARAA